MTIGYGSLSRAVGGYFEDLDDAEIVDDSLGLATDGYFTDAYDALDMDPVLGCAGDAVTLTPAVGSPSFGPTEGTASYRSAAMEILAWDDEAIVARIPLKGFSGGRAVVRTAAGNWRTTDRWRTLPTLSKEDGSEVIRLARYTDVTSSILPPIPQSNSRDVGGPFTRQRGRASILGKSIALGAVLGKLGEVGGTSDDYAAARLHLALNAGGEWVINLGRSWYRVKFASPGKWDDHARSGIRGIYPVGLALVVTSETYDSASGYFFTGRAPVEA